MTFACLTWIKNEKRSGVINLVPSPSFEQLQISAEESRELRQNLPVENRTKKIEIDSSKKLEKIGTMRKIPGLGKVTDVKYGKHIQ